MSVGLSLITLAFGAIPLAPRPVIQSAVAADTDSSGMSGTQIHWQYSRLHFQAVGQMHARCL
jgi:hypothetical protein